MTDLKNTENLISRNVQSIEISGIRKFFNKVMHFPEAISLTLGQPDFSVPEKIKKAMIKAIEENKTAYTANAGIIELREEICNYLQGFNIKYNAEEVCITIGGSEAILSVFTSLLNPGDKVLIPTPAYPAYESCVRLMGGKTIDYKLEEDFSINFVELQKLIDKEKPKILVLSYPSNPTGAVLSKEDRDKLYYVLKKKSIVIVTDEIYSSLCFEKDYYSIAQIQELKDRIILVSGFSKMFSMTGLRVGFVCAPLKFMTQIIKVHQYNVSCASSIAQYGAYAGLKDCLQDVEKMKAEFIKRRDYVYERLTVMGMDIVMPKGAFYIFPSIAKYNLKSEEFSERLLKEAHLAVVPGSAFGNGGEGHIRISYSYSLDTLKEGMDKLENWLNKNFK
ncbi:aminotransferase class I/II-fold pyridoxal phosphate-dependent enzyme [Clostridium sp. SYSU_GA19001]|uniref:pyridoxal phosphate-dependent aminotransferase n=1 Tax=Clostridium caldaquaticum TaxID=2940653 RepID=UPI00207787F3|nr:aminotransferase class I/II-fold pyridoxal phosphate-dependent enzyme [Clostridium caldaquaticum]MCM8711626.1 aminotransferase class I/II-fold pyridoxal phosphate-dependent enzyme [Clostridium caldaquaticum]